MGDGDRRDAAEFLRKARQLRDELSGAAEEISQRLGRLEERTRRGVHRAQQNFDGGVLSTREEIRAYPLTAIGIAAGVGFVLGLFLYRRR